MSAEVPDKLLWVPHYFTSLLCSINKWLEIKSYYFNRYYHFDHIITIYLNHSKKI